MTGIYKITSPTGRIYIGQSIDIAKRRKMYAGNHCKKQKRLYASLVKYGFKAHKFEVIEQCAFEDLNVREEYWISFYATFNTRKGLNLSSGGLNKRVSEETKRRISIGNSGRKRPDLSARNREPRKPATQETRIKISLAGVGRKHSKESIEIMRKKALARPPHSKETREKMSLKKKGIKLSREAVEAMLKTRAESLKTGKTVINTVTGEEFKNLKYLCDLKGYCYGTMKRKMRGASKNNTDYEYKKKLT